MRRAHDTFLHFLNDNLGQLAQPVAVHVMRRDPNDREADSLQMNAVNIGFLNVTSGNGFSSQQVSIDAVYNAENDAVDATSAVFDVLKGRYFTPLLDYSDPSVPVPVHTNLMWDRHRISFRRIVSSSYCHYNCTMALKFYSN